VALAWAVVIAAGLAHGYAVWLGLGGRAGIVSPHPIARHDHSLYFHSALVTRAFLRQSGTTAGYDPTFMAGYAKSIIFPASSTLVELVFALTAGLPPAPTYKVYVLVGTAALPWLVALAGALWRLPAGSVGWAVVLSLVYVWGDFPINYAEFGMVPYLLAIPLGLMTLALVTNYLERGGGLRWLGMAAAMSFLVLVHFTSALTVAPAVAAGYAAHVWQARRAGCAMARVRHLGIWSVPLIVLAVNAFWWWPGVRLAATKGPSDFAFAHPEPVLKRLGEIVVNSPRVEFVLVAGGILGLIAIRRRTVLAAALGGFLLAGFFWGYLAGAFRMFDFLQPGRHTYAFYTAAAMGTGLAVERLMEIVRGRAGSAGALALSCALMAAGSWWLGPGLVPAVRYRLRPGREFLSSRPTPRQLWVLNQVRRHVRPGERLLYEESGFDLPGVPDPFGTGRYSGLLPYYQPGIEVLGGPYLHAALTTNHTQFGEGKLFGKARWTREDFLEGARLYRPAAILCWSPWARRFCTANPDLIEIISDQGPLVFGRVQGFGGAAIQGNAAVEARPGRLRVTVSSAELDGTVVLRYHSVPCLRSRPAIPLYPVHLPGDPVPFIGLKATPGVWSIELDVVP
jgi:hypothetical protein